jgi:hypothetical protein
MFKKLKEIKFPAIEIKLPHITEDAARELIMIAGFIMLFIGVWGYDWRIACIFGGWILMKFSGLVKRVIL